MATYRELGRVLAKMATQVAYDPGYRRLKYVRDADDFLLGFHGPESEAETIKGRIGDFLGDHLKLELSPEKTLITPASEKARFLGYEITTYAKRDSETVSRRIRSRRHQVDDPRQGGGEPQRPVQGQGATQAQGRPPVRRRLYGRRGLRLRVQGIRAVLQTCLEPGLVRSPALGDVLVIAQDAGEDPQDDGLCDAVEVRRVPHHVGPVAAGSPPNGFSR